MEYNNISSVNFHSYDYKDFYIENPKLFKNKLFTNSFQKFRRENIDKYKNIIKNDCVYFASINIDTLLNAKFVTLHDTFDLPIIYIFDDNFENLRIEANIKKEEIINDISNLSHIDFVEKYVGVYLNDKI